jgi:high-affinity iron transporter
VIVLFLVMRYKEIKGHWPLMKRKDSQLPAAAESEPEEGNEKSTSQAAEPSEDKAKARGEVTLVSV